MRPVRVALIGLGWVGQQVWLPALAESSAYEVTALVDIAPAALAAAAAVAPRAWRGRRPDPIGPDIADLAVVAVPNDLHTETAEALLARDVSVFVEKPVCLSSTELRRLRAAEAGGRGALLAGSAGRYRADVRRLRALLPSLGSVRLVELSWIRASGIPRRGGWFTSSSRAGGGALLDLGWHLLDVGLDLLGRPEVVRAVGVRSADLVHDPRWAADWRADVPTGGAPLGEDVEDSATGFLVTEGGVGVSVSAAWASHQPYDVTTVRLHGSAGTATLRCTFGFSPQRVAGPELVLSRAGRTESVPLPSEPVGAEYDRQLADLPRLLADRGTRGRAVAEAGPVLRALEALYAGSVAPAAPGVLALADGER